MRTLRLHLLMSLLATVSGAVLAQTCPLGHTPNAPNSRYTVQTDSSQVKDSKTALIWQRCSLGQTWDGNSSTCTGSATTMNWQAALTAAANAGSSGGFAWRLPNLKELASLPELACNAPAINITMFPGTPLPNFWSSSSGAGHPSYAWVVSFNDGYDNLVYKTNSYYVRLVRSSQ